MRLATSTWPGSPPCEAQASAILIAEAVFVGSAALDERQCLERLHSGARIDRPRHIAEREHGRAIRIDHRDCAAMAAFDKRAAHHLDQNRITHLSCSPDCACHSSG